MPCLPGEHFREDFQAVRVQADRGTVHFWGAFHCGTKSPLVRFDYYLNAVVYRGIMDNTLQPFARQHFENNFRYQNENAMPHTARVVAANLQQEGITKMEHRAKSPYCNPIEYLWDELSCAINRIDNPLQNLRELRQALLDRWA